MRAQLIAVLALLSMRVAAQDVPCPPPSKYALPDSPASEYKFNIEDTAGLNIVARPLSVGITLAEGHCPPTWPSDDLMVSVTYFSDGELAEEVKRLQDGSDVKKPAQADKMFGFEDWRVVSKAPLKVGQLGGVEVLGQAKGPNGTFFWHTSYLLYPDGVGFSVTTRGLDAQREAALPRARRIAASVRRLDNRGPRGEKELKVEGEEALGGTMTRLRASIVDEALDACLTGESVEAVAANARAAGWPEFQDDLFGGASWRVSQMPPNDSAKVSLGVTEMQLEAGRALITCTIGAASPLAAVFRDRAQARFGSIEGRLEFSIDGGKVQPGKRARGQAGRRGVVQLEVSDKTVVFIVAMERTN